MPSFHIGKQSSVPLFCPFSMYLFFFLFLFCSASVCWLRSWDAWVLCEKQKKARSLDRVAPSAAPVIPVVSITTFGNKSLVSSTHLTKLFLNGSEGPVLDIRSPVVLPKVCSLGCWELPTALSLVEFVACFRWAEGWGRNLGRFVAGGLKSTLLYFLFIFFIPCSEDRWL
jgi:hypothetical protein